MSDIAQVRPGHENCIPPGEPLTLTYLTPRFQGPEFTCECGKRWVRNASYPGGWDRG